MSYNKQNFVNGQPLTAQQLNHIENGIVQLDTELNNVNTEITNIEDNYATKDFVRSEINNAEIGGDGELDVDLSIYALKTEIPKYIQTGAQNDSSIGNKSTIEGENNIGSGNYSHAEGVLNTASGNYSHAEGYQTETTGVAAHAEGAIYNNVKTSANGRASHAEGAGTRALVDATHTEGILTLAGRTYAEAQQAAVDLNMSFDSSEELYMKLLGYGAHAEGTNTQALGSSSHAEGSLTQALVNSSHAEGDSTCASGEASHAEGYDTVASGNQSHAEGKSTLASGNSSHAEGKESEARSYCAHAEGLNTLAKGRSSHTEGVETIATTEAQHVQGRYNIEDIAGTYAHIVGNGTEEDGRSNAHTLDWDGNAWFAGAINCEDKTTTLANLGAAPAGYGLGGGAEQKDWSEVDSVTANGTYRFNGIHQTINGIYVTSATMLVINFGDSYCTQILRTVENASGHYKSYTLVRSKGAIGWDGWECPDPPMVVGVEYRTTERHNGLPVYTQLVNFGTLPNSTEKRLQVYYSANENKGLICAPDIISITPHIYGDTDDKEWTSLPFIYGGNTPAGDMYYRDGSGITVRTQRDLSKYNALFTVKYTKEYA